MTSLAKSCFFFGFMAIAVSLGAAYQGRFGGALFFWTVSIGVVLSIFSFFLSLLVAVFRPVPKGQSSFELPLLCSLSMLFNFCLISVGTVLYFTELKDKPMLNDVTTDMSNPPIFRGTFVTGTEGMDFSEGINSRRYKGSNPGKQRILHPEIEPLVLEMAAPIVYEAAELAAKTTPGWKMILQEPDKLHLEASSVSKTFKFVDDISIDVLPQENGSVLQMRSRSRMGYFDFGANAKRIVAFQQKVKEIIPKILRRRQSQTPAAPPTPPEGAVAPTEAPSGK